MNQHVFKDFILALDDVWLDHSLGDKRAVYKYGKQPEGKMMAIVEESSNPLRVSLRCDPLLAKTLRERYETVLPGENLNKNTWNTIICSGQLTDDEIYDLIRHSYEVVQGEG